MGITKKKMLYVQTRGMKTPDRLYSPFIFAMTAKAMDLDASIFFLGEGITVLKKGEAENLDSAISFLKAGAGEDSSELQQLERIPSLRKLIEQSINAGVKLYVCDQSRNLLDLKETDFIEEAEIAGAATLNDLALEADGDMWL